MTRTRTLTGRAPANLRGAAGLPGLRAVWSGEELD
jgi:hypothetical protein